MAEKVEIIVTAKDSASQILRGISSSFGGIGNAVQMLTSGGGFEMLTSQIVQFGKQSVEATVAYADEVRRLSQISGQSAEETSRLIQLSDDYKISAGDLTVAMRKLTNEGLTLNVDTLAQLSDQYMKLNPGQERAAFLMEKFGRQGVKFAEIMGKGGDEIRKMNAGIDQNLLLTDEAVRSAREYEMAMDTLGEQTLKLQYALGVKLVPALTEMINIVNDDLNPAWQAWDDQMLKTNWTILDAEWWSTTASIQAYEAAISQATVSADRFDKMSGDVTKTIDTETISVEELAKAQSDANKEYLSLLQDIVTTETDYNSSMIDISTERTQIEKERTGELAKGWQTSKEKVQDYDNQLAELDAKVADTAAKHKTATDEIILSNVLAKLSVGELTNAELEQYLTLEVAMGKITEKDKDLATGQQALIDAFIAGKLGAEQLKSALDLLPSGKTIDVIMNMVTRMPASYYSTGESLRDQYKYGNRASGGPVSAGDWYRVNETNQEYFRPYVGGSVMPIGPGGGGGSGMTVVIQASTVIGDKSHIENYLLPVIREGLRQVQAGR